MSLYGGDVHRCTRHDRPNCTLQHQALPFVRTYRGPGQAEIGQWTPAYEREIPARPWWRYLIAAAAILLIVATILFASIYAGQSAADGFGPLIPTTTPHPTPYPGGWTP